MTEPTPYSGTAGPPEAVALVILPFASEDQALAFANLVRGRNDGRTAIVTAGSCLEFVVDTTQDAGQIIKLRGGWDSYADPEQPDTLIVARGQGF